MSSDLAMAVSAEISTCGFYRLRLDVDFKRPGPVVSIGMVNPASADGERTDQTMRKVVGFSQRLGASRTIVWNKFAWRDQDVRGLARTADPIGTGTDARIAAALRESDIRIVAWGPLAKLPKRLRGRWREVAAIADGVGCELVCWGTAGDGQPLHPLTLSYGLHLRRWERPI